MHTWIETKTVPQVPSLLQASTNFLVLQLAKAKRKLTSTSLDLVGHVQRRGMWKNAASNLIGDPLFKCITTDLTQYYYLVS